MPAWDDVVRMAADLPETEQSTMHGSACLRVHRKAFAVDGSHVEGYIVLWCAPEEKAALLASGDPGLQHHAALRRARLDPGRPGPGGRRATGRTGHRRLAVACAGPAAQGVRRGLTVAGSGSAQQVRLSLPASHRARRAAGPRRRRWCMRPAPSAGHRRRPDPAHGTARTRRRLPAGARMSRSARYRAASAVDRPGNVTNSVGVRSSATRVQDRALAPGLDGLLDPSAQPTFVTVDQLVRR